MKRVFLIVLDSFGIGEQHDAYKFNDVGSNTLKSVSKSKQFVIPTLESLGLNNIDGIDYRNNVANPIGAYARLQEKSNGKDTINGHWEIAGVVSNKIMNTFPNGFPDEFIKILEKELDTGFLCNKPYSGTEVIRDYGEEHVRTGKPILYTSADSVLQLAAHVDVISLDKLYNYCKKIRELATGPYEVGRVIARPFEGRYPLFIRTKDRHDYSVLPPKRTLLDELKDNNYDVISIGKIKDIFSNQGITQSMIAKNNDEALTCLDSKVMGDFTGLCFANLVDFDMIYGHRNDIDGYASALSIFDEWLKKFITLLKEEDVVFITADHGCDPGTKSTDHSREYTPLIIYGKKIKPVNLKTRLSFADIACTIRDMFNLNIELDGDSFYNDIVKEGVK